MKAFLLIVYLIMPSGPIQIGQEILANRDSCFDMAYKITTKTAHLDAVCRQADYATSLQINGQPS